MRGRAAEGAVAEYLEGRGVVVLARNLRVGRYEVDILGRDGDTVVVVEVRTRGYGAFESAFASVTAEKMRRLRAAGEVLWRTRFRRDPTLNRLRIDVASVVFLPDGAHVEYAAGVG